MELTGVSINTVTLNFLAKLSPLYKYTVTGSSIVMALSVVELLIIFQSSVN